MAEKRNPSISVDWDSGEAALHLGTRLEGEHPLFKVDILGDIRGDANVAYEAAYEELYPGQNAREQRRANLQRRTVTQTLIGQTILDAKALRNGDVALKLSNGNVVVLCSDTTDVQLRAADSIEQVVEYAEEQCPGTHFIEEPTAEDAALAATTERNRMVAELGGIAAP